MASFGFFQYHCYINVRVPRIDCQNMASIGVDVPWSNKGSGFTVMFEQVIMSLVREMPVNAVARHVGVTDKRIWRVVTRYVMQAVSKLDCSQEV
jgi:hypothetical protein